MAADIVDLREFYLSPLGKAVRDVLRRRLRAAWPDFHEGVLAGFGFATPLLRPWLDETRSAARLRLLSFMPGAQGAVFWPREGPNKTALADFSDLPLPDESIDRAVVLHTLETVADPDAFLRELWRVLKGQGRALLIVPHRHGLWAYHDETPFGVGRPYSLEQLKTAVRGQGFIVGRAGRALYFPPLRWRFLLAFAERIERWGRFFLPCLAGGLLVVEVEKQLYAPLFSKVKVQRRTLWPVALPSGAAGRWKADG